MYLQRLPSKYDCLQSRTRIQYYNQRRIWCHVHKRTPDFNSNLLKVTDRVVIVTDDLNSLRLMHANQASNQKANGNLHWKFVTLFYRKPSEQICF